MAEQRQLAERLGIDLSLTLERFGERQDILEKFLRRFPSDPTFSEIASALNQKDDELLERSVHTLKGLAANLGLELLSNICQMFLCDIRKGNTDCYAFHFQQLTKEYDRIIDCYKQ